MSCGRFATSVQTSCFAQVLHVFGGSGTAIVGFLPGLQLIDRNELAIADDGLAAVVERDKAARWYNAAHYFTSGSSPERTMFGELARRSCSSRRRRSSTGWLSCVSCLRQWQ